MTMVRVTHIITDLEIGGAEIMLETPETGVAPGQACVIYDGPRVLGGGWIARKNTDTASNHAA
jgi:tRNA-specific 2-thiouridylase